MEKKQMYGVLGLGSMGKRRVRDLLQLGKDVVGYDVREDRMEEIKHQFGIETVSSFDELVAKSPKAIVISTPPDTHIDYYKQAFQHKLPFFTEANILSPQAEWFEEQSKTSGVTGYPSASWKFHPSFRFLKDTLASETHIYSVHHHYVEFLPDWHPWEDYADFYAGKPLTFAAREMVPFDMEALCWIFGKVHSVSATAGRSRDWETDILDYYHLQLKFESGVVGTLVIELHPRAATRVTRVSTENKTYTLDMAEGFVREYDACENVWRYHHPGSKRVKGGFEFEEVYFEEMRAFVEAVEGREQYEKSWEEERHLSDILYAAEISCVQQRWVEVGSVSGSYDGQTLGSPLIQTTDTL